MNMFGRSGFDDTITGSARHNSFVRSAMTVFVAVAVRAKCTEVGNGKRHVNSDKSLKAVRKSGPLEIYS